MSQLKVRWFSVLAIPLLLILQELGAQVPTPQARIVQEVNTASLAVIHGNLHTAKVATADYGAVESSQKLQNMVLLLAPSDKQKTDLDALIAAQQNASSASYHKWLTPAEYGARFGVADADIAKITAWLGNYGLSVDQVSAGRTMLVFSGTHAQFSAAFHTTLHSYLAGGTKVIANNSELQIPAALAGVVRGVATLNSIRKVGAHKDFGPVSLNHKTGEVKLAASDLTTTPTTFSTLSAQTTSATSKATPLFNVPLSSGGTYRVMTPQDFATIYNLRPSWNNGIDGRGQKIAIIGRSRVNKADVDYFRSTFGLPETKLTQMIAGGVDPGLSSDEPENALDVEWSGAIAKEADIILVAAASSYTADGIDIAALYAVDNNVAPIINVSYGQCESSLGETGNAFYSALWEQAMAQGISVFVATGDAGAATCNQGSSDYATSGMTISGLASTPYNVGVGGTDFYGNHLGSSNYWNSENDATMGSAKSYVPEAPWGDSCANPLVQQLLLAHGYAGDSPAAMCQTMAWTAYFSLAGGGGGVSAIYNQPLWQAGVAGMPANSKRNLPDVSLFSGDGVWGSFLIYCASDLNPSGSCDLGDISNLEGAGGTSFASPQFAGIMALINQKAGANQGNPNAVLYTLGQQQYAGSTSCSATNGIPPASCVFHDVDQGSNATPCWRGSPDCTVASSSNQYGALNGHAATTGYDLATGLGSVDVSNLLNAWSAATATRETTATTLDLGKVTTAVYGQGLTGTVTVKGASTTPSGDVSILNDSSVADSAVSNVATLSEGTASATLSLLPAGSYNVTAHYEGDATHASSDSTAVKVTIAKATPATTISASRSTLSAGQNALLTLNLATAGQGAAPTGSVSFTNAATSQLLGTATLSSASSNVSTAFFSVPANLLSTGSNLITASYSGDTNYAAAVANTTLTFSAPYSMTLGNASLQVGTTAGSSNSTTVVIAATNGGTPAWPVTLQCTGTLPVGASCNVSTQLLSNGATTATITVNYTPTATPVTPSANQRRNSGTIARGLTAGMSGLFLLGFFRKRRKLGSLFVFLMMPLSMLTISCGGSAHPTAQVALASSSSAISYGSSVSLTATVAGNGQSPTGTVVFQDASNGGYTTLGSVPLANGSAQWSSSSLPLGAHAITALYSGDASHPQATSTTTSVSVSYKASLNVTAIDANGYTVSAPLTVNIQ